MRKGPIAVDCIALALRFVAEVWEALTDPRGARAQDRLLLSDLSQAWRHVASRPPTSWQHARGPIGAVWLVFGEVGWRWVQAFKLLSQHGGEVELFSHSPGMLRHVLLDA